RSDQIGLPMIAELSNGRLAAVRQVVQQIHHAAGTNTAVHTRGVWRLWMEHKSSQPMQQGDVVPPSATTAVLHVFEIHPVTEFSGTRVLDTFSPLKDDAHPSKHFEASDAQTAFGRYESSKLTVDRTTPIFTFINGPQTPFNYVEFRIETSGTQTVVDDGTFRD